MNATIDSVPDRYKVILVGDQEVHVPGSQEAIPFLARILHREGSSTFIVQGTGKEYASLEVAKAATDESDNAEVKVTTAWRESVDPLPGEQACFLCGGTIGVPMEAATRYPKRLCDVCHLELTDAKGRRVQFFNTHFGSGIKGSYVESGEPYARTDCYVRGVRCRAEEKYFRGIVVRPVKG